MSFLLKKYRTKIAILYPFIYSFLIEKIRKIRNSFRYKKCFNKPYYHKSISSPISLEKPNNQTIFFCIYWFKPSGAEYYALECARLAKENGFQVVWIVEFPSDNDDWTQKFLDISEDVYYVYSIESGEDPLNWLVGLTQKFSPLAFHIHHSNFCYTHLQDVKKHFPSLITIDTTHIIELKDEGFPCASVSVQEALDYRNVISYGLQKYYVEHGFSESSILRSVIIPDVKDHKINMPKISNNLVHIKIIGRLDEQKRPYLILPFINELRRLQQTDVINKNLTIKISIYGIGEYYQVLNEELKRQSIDNVEIITNCYDQDAIYNSAFCIVQLSENEGVSLVSYESTLRYKYILTTDVGQQNEVIEKDFLLPSSAKKAVEVAAYKLSELIRNPEGFQERLLLQRKKILQLDKKYGYKKRMHAFYASLM